MAGKRFRKELRKEKAAELLMCRCLPSVELPQPCCRACSTAATWRVDSPAAACISKSDNLQPCNSSEIGVTLLKHTSKSSSLSLAYTTFICC